MSWSIVVHDCVSFAIWAGEHGVDLFALAAADEHGVGDFEGVAEEDAVGVAGAAFVEAFGVGEGDGCAATAAA